MMTRRQSILAYVALLVGAIAFASSFARTSPGQQAATTPPTPGRYQASAASWGSGSIVFVTDTQTGRTWSHFSNGSNEWHDFGTPLNAK